MMNIGAHIRKPACVSVRVCVCEREKGREGGRMNQHLLWNVNKSSPQIVEGRVLLFLECNLECKQSAPER